MSCPEKAERFELDAFWFWHTVNAYETAQGTVVDLCAYEEPDFDSIGTDTPEAPRPYLERLILDSGQARRERLWDVPCDFPSLPTPLHGERYDRGFFQVQREGADGIGSYDLSSRREALWLSPQGHKPSEPVFAADSNPLEGWLLSLVQAPEKSRSYLAILDTRRLEAGPVAPVWFDQEIPLTFHGNRAPGIGGLSS